MHFGIVLSLSILIFLPLAYFEVKWYRHQNKAYAWNEAVSSIWLHIGSRVVGVLYLYLIYEAYLWVYKLSMPDIAMDQPWSWLLLFTGVEFFYYWFHRLSHEIRWMWASHNVHHTPKQFNIFVSLRIGLTSFFSMGWLIYLPLVLLGFPPEAILFMLGVNLLYQFWIHTEMFDKLPAWFEFIFNTPSHHRVHHATNPGYLDRNHGGILILFDRLFGTFKEEEKGNKPTYGLVKALHSDRPVDVAFHEWRDMMDDVKSARNLNDVVGYCWGAPGWAPQENKETSASIKDQNKE